MINLDTIKQYRPGSIIFDSTIELTPASVMILIHRTRNTVLFIERSNTVKTHRGQVGLPGGSIEKSESPLEAAYRETREEIGLEQNAIEVVGEIDALQTNTDYLVYPFIGLWETDERLVKDEREVSDIFEVDLEFLLDHTNCRRESWSLNGFFMNMFFWEYNGHTIWGVTGLILATFFRIIKGKELIELTPLSESREKDLMH